MWQSSKDVQVDYLSISRIIFSKTATSKRLLYGLYLLNRTHLSHIYVDGLENLKAISENQRVIFATTHLGELDMPAACSIIGTYRDIIIANQSLHHHFFQKTGVNIAMHISGTQNFLPVDYENIKHPKALFHPHNFIEMKKALEKNKALVIAAHNPVLDSVGLPDSGYGAVYAYSITDNAIIVPITINITSDRPVDTYALSSLTLRPDAYMYIHPPMHVNKIPEHSSSYPVNREHLRQEGDKVMRVLASRLPIEKRGIYH